MTRKIIIEGGLARVIEEQIIGEASLTRLMPSLRTFVPTVLPVLPQDLTALKWDPTENYGLIMVRRPPQVVTVNIWMSQDDDEDYDPDDPGGETHTYRLAMPWLYWLFEVNTASITDPAALPEHVAFGSAFLYCSPSRIHGENDIVWPMPFPNVYDNGEICWGSQSGGGGPLSSRIDTRVNEFFHGSFNGDVQYRTPYGEHEFRAWETATNTNEYAYLDWDLFQHPSAGYTVASLIGGNRPEIQVTDTPPNALTTLAAMRAWRDSLTPARRERLTRIFAETAS